VGNKVKSFANSLNLVSNKSCRPGFPQRIASYQLRMKLPVFFLFIVLNIGQLALVSAGACSNDFNINYWKNEGGFFEFRGQMSTCGFRMIVTANTTEQVRIGETCLVDEGMPYNSECITCFAQLAQCAIEFCKSECLVDSTSAICEGCNEENCNSPYYDCSGTDLDVSGCSDCTQPETSIIPGIADAAFFSAVAIAGIGLGMGVYWVFMCKREEEWDEYNDGLFDDEQFKPKKVNIPYAMAAGSSRRQSLDDNFGQNVFGAASQGGRFDVFEPVHTGEDVPLDEV